MNQVCLIGNLTRDVELRYTTDQRAIAKFGIAINDGYGENQKTTFIDITAFGKQAENAEKFIGKGSKVGIMGRLSASTYEKDGKNITRYEVIANNIEYLSAKQAEPTGFTAMREDDVPWA